MQNAWNEPSYLVIHTIVMHGSADFSRLFKDKKLLCMGRVFCFSLGLM